MTSLLLIALPLVAGLLTLGLPGKAARSAAIVAALAELVLAIYAIMQLDPAGGDQLQFTANWLVNHGFYFSLAMDGISGLLVLLTASLVPLIILSTIGKHDDKPAVFYSLMLIMQSALVGVFTARDGLLFYLMWEAALIPVYFLAAIWGGDLRVRVTLKFFIYTLFGSLFMLAALAYLYVQTHLVLGHYSAAMEDLYSVGAQLPRETQFYIFWALFLAFGIKMPVFPLHTWQPDTYAESPAPATILLSGIMLKMGIYGLIKWLLPIAPEGVHFYAPYVMALAITGVVYGSVIAIRQKDIKRLVAYSSFAHVGLMAAAIFTLSPEGIQGAVVQMFAHGVSVAGLFMIIDYVERRTGTRDILALGGITQGTPVLTVLFMIITLGAVALPLTSGFVGEFLMLLGLGKYNLVAAAVAGTTIILGAVYMLVLFQGIMFGKKGKVVEKNGFADLTAAETLALIPLAVLTFWIGLYPAPFLKLTEPAVLSLISSLGAH